MQYQQLADSGLPPKDFVTQALQLFESDLRRVGLLALSDWQKLKVVAPELFTAAAGLGRPSWGTWNGLILALRKARGRLLGEKEGDWRQKIDERKLLQKVFEVYDRPLNADDKAAMQPLADLTRTSMRGQLKWGAAVTMPIQLRNRIAHDNPTDLGWWNQTSAAIGPLVELLARHNPWQRIVPADRKYPVPWFAKAKNGEVLTYNGLQKNEAIYVSQSGKSVYSDKGGAQVLLSLKQLFGKSDLQEQDFRKLLGKLAPAEMQGVLLGDFLVSKPVGQGGYATVHYGRQLSTERQVAVKILHDGLPEDASLRFRQEAAMLSRFQHPNIVGVYSHGEDPWSAPRAFSLDKQNWYKDRFKKSSPVKTYIALEWVQGTTLEDFFKATPPPSTEQLIHWFRQSCQALATVHAANLVHRDIKPSNLMVDENGDIKLMDFGIARSDREDQEIQTTLGRTLGTPAYMSPEQITAVDADAEVGSQSDVYSLCATFYELFTGQRLYQHDQANEELIKTQKLQGQLPQRPRQIDTDLSWEVETLLLGGLETHLSDRINSAQALADDLQRILDNRPIQYKRPSIGRRLQLAYRRNKRVAQVTAAAAAMILMVSAIAYTLIIFAQGETATERAERQKQETLATNRLLKTGLLRAQREQQSKNYVQANIALEEIDKRLRHWEWFYLHRLVNAELGRVDVGKKVRQSLGEQAYGQIGALAYFNGRPFSKKDVLSTGDCLAAYKTSDAVTIWNVTRNKKVVSKKIKQPNRMQFSESGDVLMIQNGEGVRFWSFERERNAQFWRRQNGWQHQLPAFNGDMDFFAVLTDEGVHVNHNTPFADAEEDGDVCIKQPAGARFNAVAVSPSGDIVVTAADDLTLSTWEAISGEQQHSIKLAGNLDGRSPTEKISFSPDGQFIVAPYKTRPSYQRGVLVFSAADPNLKKTFGDVDISFAPNGQYFLAISSTGNTAAYDASTLESIGTIKLDGRISGSRLKAAVVYSQTGAQFGIATNSGIHVFDTKSRQKQFSLSDPMMQHSDFAINSKKGEVATAHGYSAKIWSGAAGRGDSTIAGRDFFVLTDNTIATLSGAGVSIADPATGQVLRSVQLSRDRRSRNGAFAMLGIVTAVEPNGKWLVTTGQWNSANRGDINKIGVQPILVWDISTNSATFKGELRGEHEGPIQRLGFAADGSKLVSVDNKDQLVIWNIGAMRAEHRVGLPKSLEQPRDLVTLSFAKSKPLVGVGRHDVVPVLVNLESGQIVKNLGEAGAGFGISHDGSHLVSSHFLYDVKSGSKIADLQGTISPTRFTGSTSIPFAFSPDGKRLAGSNHSVITIWDAESGTEIISFPIRGIARLAFSPNGRYLFAASATGVKIMDSRKEFK